jgi:hypothetical protein
VRLVLCFCDIEIPPAKESSRRTEPGYAEARGRQYLDLLGVDLDLLARTLASQLGVDAAVFAAYVHGRNTTRREEIAARFKLRFLSGSGPDNRRAALSAHFTVRPFGSSRHRRRPGAHGADQWRAAA